MSQNWIIMWITLRCLFLIRKRMKEMAKLWMFDIPKVDEKKTNKRRKNVKLPVVRHRVFYGVSHSSQPVINILTLFHLVLFNRIDEIFKPRITVFKSSNSNANPIWEAHHVSAAIPFLQISRRAHFLVFSPLLIWMNNRHGITNLNRLC